MSDKKPRLADRFELSCSNVLLNGTQALVRLVLEQAFRDRRAGINTAGYVTGYRGSPLGAVDFQMERAKSKLEQAQVLFAPAINEDLAATALWGTQQAELRGEGRHDGVFGLWYGKGPGVDRSGDVLRHANRAGTSRYGGVVMAMGDDHTGESSTTLHQSEFALMDSYIPIVSPAGVQELIDYGLYGYALSRFSGSWVGLKCVKETVESTATIDGDPDRLSIRIPDFELPAGGLNIRLHDTPRAQEARMIDFKRPALEAFWRENRLDRRILGRPGAKIGFVSAGKSWLDLAHAVELLGLEEADARLLGLTTYKVGMTWPLDRSSLLEWAEGLELIVVVEEKRKLVEFQVREALSSVGSGIRVIGRHDETGAEIFPTKYALEPVSIARRLGGILEAEGRIAEEQSGRLARLRQLAGTSNSEDIARRLPYFCSGCPHNSSTRLPDGSRAYAGIGCHYMVQWMDRDTIGFTHMGGEGANWIGEAPFSTRDHVFQNMGDGTYNHSGLMAIRAAVAANANMTFKILFNDAVAMTGGQRNDGELTAAQIAHELIAFGVKDTVLVYDDKEDIDFAEFPAGIARYERTELDAVQRRLREVKGVSAIVYVQTCAAEKRRRRKRGTFPDIDKRVFINTEVCEGCGDCSVQSNCVSIVPVDTWLGTKRAIDQSSCNKDFSCLKGFCPSFVTVEGARAKRRKTLDLNLSSLPEPNIPEIDGTWNVVVTGIGGTGVVTIGAVLTMAAHLDGKGAAMIEMAGLAQKGGEVCIHCRIADRQQDISAIRVAVGEANCIVGGDLVVSAGSEILALAAGGRTGASINDHETITGEFTRRPGFRIPGERLRQRMAATLDADRVGFLDSTILAQRVLGDSIYSNMVVFGHAWQSGLLPLTRDAIESAIELNGAAVESNLKAFALGRWSALNAVETRELVSEASTPTEGAAADAEQLREAHLVEHTGLHLAARWRALLERCPNDELRAAVAEGYHRVLAVKDEYEVARLHLATDARARDEFDGDIRLRFHLAPPIMSRTGPDGRPVKKEFGPWMLTVFRLLARLKWLRGTPLDPFRYSRDRRLQRDLRTQYEQDIHEILEQFETGDFEAALELARLPLEIKGYGPVWETNYEIAMARRQALLEAFRSGPGGGMRMAAE